VVDAHRDVVSGFGGLLRFGTDVTVVRGNHDVDLARPQTQDRLARLLGADADRWLGRLAFTPWLLHLSGLLIAEHGHQHHDINRFERQLWPFTPEWPAGRVEEPFGAALSRLRRTGRGPTLHGKVAWAALRHGLRMQSPGRRCRSEHYRRSALPQMISELGLPLATAQQLDAMSERSAVQVLTRIARQCVGRFPAEDGYLPKAAQAVATILGQSTPPYLVYGHNHAADAIPISHPSVFSTYLNTGTWCRRGPRPGGTSLTPASATWVEIDDGPGHRARVCAWVDSEPRVLAQVVAGRVEDSGIPPGSGA